MTAQILELAAKIVADAKNERIDDAAFRRRARRLAAQLHQALDQASAPAQRDGARSASRKTARAPSRYVFVAVPNGEGGTTSVSIVTSVFDELAEALGGRNQVTALARKVAGSHKPESGISRSAYVLRRLQQRAAKAAAAPEPPESTRRSRTSKS